MLIFPGALLCIRFFRLRRSVPCAESYICAFSRPPAISASHSTLDLWAFDRGLLFRSPDHPMFRSPDFSAPALPFTQGLKDLAKLIPSSRILNFPFAPTRSPDPPITTSRDPATVRLFWISSVLLIDCCPLVSDHPIHPSPDHPIQLCSGFSGFRVLLIDCCPLVSDHPIHRSPDHPIHHLSVRPCLRGRCCLGF